MKKTGGDDIGVDLKLKDRSLPEGFWILHGPDEIAQLDSFFEALLQRNPVKFDPSKYADFSEFVSEVFRTH